MANAADSSPRDPHEDELTPELALVDPELALRARERLAERTAAAPSESAPPTGVAPTQPPPKRVRRAAGALMVAAVVLGGAAVGIAIPVIFLDDSPRSISEPVALDPPTAGVAPTAGAPTATGATGNGSGFSAAPAAGQPRTFGWVPVERASHYHVSFFRGRQKIFETWPRRARLVLPTQWTFNGRRDRLSPGEYRWVVRPGFGARREGRYGRPVVDATLLIRR